jgi:hypothetical protein
MALRRANLGARLAIERSRRLERPSPIEILTARIEVLEGTVLALSAKLSDVEATADYALERAEHADAA